MKKRLIYLILPIITLISELLPCGRMGIYYDGYVSALCIVPFSYFDSFHPVYNYFVPFITAVITCIILIFLLVYLFTDSPYAINIAKGFLYIGSVFSLYTLIFDVVSLSDYDIDYFPVVGVLITVTLIGELIFTVVTVKTNNEIIFKRMKKKKIIIFAIILILIIPFVPIPAGSFDDGGSRMYRSLTYTAVAWNRLYSKEDENENSDSGVYKKLSVFWYPDSQDDINGLWEMELESKAD